MKHVQTYGKRNFFKVLIDNSDSQAALMLLLIEKGEPHQITNTARKDLVTINFYVPRAYDKNGELLSEKELLQKLMSLTR